MAVKKPTKDEILRARGDADAASMERLYGKRAKAAKKAKKK